MFVWFVEFGVPLPFQRFPRYPQCAERNKQLLFIIPYCFAFPVGLLLDNIFFARFPLFSLLWEEKKIKFLNNRKQKVICSLHDCVKQAERRKKRRHSSWNWMFAISDFLIADLFCWRKKTLKITLMINKRSESVLTVESYDRHFLCTCFYLRCFTAWKCRFSQVWAISMV